MDMSAVRACRILTYGNRTQLFPANKLLNTYRLTKWRQVSKMREKKTARPSTLYRVSWVQENNPWIRDKVRKSEKGSSRTTVTTYQLWKTKTVTRALTGAPRL